MGSYQGEDLYGVPSVFSCQALLMPFNLSFILSSRHFALQYILLSCQYFVIMSLPSQPSMSGPPALLILYSPGQLNAGCPKLCQARLHFLYSILLDSLVNDGCPKLCQARLNSLYSILLDSLVNAGCHKLFQARLHSLYSILLDS